jgi:hypothetical protein
MSNLQSWMPDRFPSQFQVVLDNISLSDTEDRWFATPWRIRGGEERVYNARASYATLRESIAFCTKSYSKKNPNCELFVFLPKNETTEVSWCILFKTGFLSYPSMPGQP